MTLAEVYAQIPASTCPPECGRCCGILFPSTAELRNVANWCAKHRIEYKDFTMLVGDECPYLLPDKGCQIYPVRPFLCRIMGTGEDLPCPINLNKPERLLNHAQSNAMYKAIYLRGKEKSRTEKHIKIIHGIFEELSL